jgi:hypothetical protein
MMHEGRKSDVSVVVMKPVNEAAQAAEELVERRGMTEGNEDQQSTPRTPSRTNVTQALDRIRRFRR